MGVLLVVGQPVEPQIPMEDRKNHLQRLYYHPSQVHMKSLRVFLEEEVLRLRAGIHHVSIVALVREDLHHTLPLPQAGRQLRPIMMYQVVYTDLGHRDREQEKGKRREVQNRSLM